MLYIWLLVLSLSTNSEESILDNNSTIENPSLITVVLIVPAPETKCDNCIDSILEQTIGFENHIELVVILQNHDTFPSILSQRFGQSNPQNVLITSVKTDNINHARNVGLQHATGEYVLFAHPSYVWKRNAFETTIDLFKTRGTVEDLPCIVILEKQHYVEVDHLPFKNAFAIVNLQSVYDSQLDLSIFNCMFNLSAIEEIRFCEELEYDGGFRFLSTVLLSHQCKLGTVRNTYYVIDNFYDTTSSTLPLQSRYINDYITIRLCYCYLFDLSRLLYGKVVTFLQQLIMERLTVRIENPNVYQLYQNDSAYVATITELLRGIDDAIILQRRGLRDVNSLTCLSVKYGFTIENRIHYVKGSLLLGKHTIFSVRKKRLILWTFLSVEDGILTLEGRDLCPLPRDSYLYRVYVDGVERDVIYESYPQFDIKTLFGVSSYGQTVKFSLPLTENKGMKITFSFFYRGHTDSISFSVGKYVHIPPIRSGYYVAENWIFSVDSKSLTIEPRTFGLHVIRELHYSLDLLKLGKLSVLFYRLLYRVHGKGRKDIWLISDRQDQADDNGRHFFEYVQRTLPPSVKAYFCMSRKASAFRFMKTIGPVLDTSSWKYRLFFLLSDKTISSQDDESFLNPFSGDRAFLTDLYRSDFVFLQHGLTKDDVSGWLHRYQRNIKCFITVAPREYQSIISPRYGYTEKVVQLTGFPRHDKLLKLQENYSDRKNITNILLVLPTWRKYLFFQQGTAPMNTYKSEFRKTAYYSFYNTLINHPRLHAAMVKHNYRGLFALHPNFLCNSIDFSDNALFQIAHSYVNYQEALVSSSILVTDYSSVAFDYALLKKPIVYSHFDSDNMSSLHFYEPGYFDYEKDGFGPICHSAESTVDAIISVMNNQSRVSDYYLNRIESFYLFFDTNNSKRVYDAITGLPSHHPLSKQVNKQSLLVCICLLIISFLVWKLHSFCGSRLISQDRHIYKND